MSDDENQGPRVYGQAEEAKPEVATSNGLRGEANAAPDAATSQRTVRMNGREVSIEEETGPGQVEAERHSDG